MRTKSAHWAFLALSLIAVLAAFAAFFERIPTQNNTLAMDWKTFWPSLRGGDIQYLPLDGLRFPPWSLVPLLPLGYLPMQTAWGILAGVGITILVVSVPRVGSRPLYWLSVFLLVASFPSLRNIADGNVESLVVGGVLLILHGYNGKRPYLIAIGLLIATIKIQEVALLVLVLGVYLLRAWVLRDWIKTGLFVAAAVVLSLLWRGQAWLVALFGPNYLKYTNSIIDIGITAALKRLGFVPSLIITITWIAILGITLLVVWRSRPVLSREKAGMLIAGSLLIAPYAAGNSVLSVLAIGVIPLFQKNQLLGGILIGLINLPFLFAPDTLYNFQAYYWTVIVTLTWVIFSWRSLANNAELVVVEKHLGGYQ